MSSGYDRLGANVPGKLERMVKEAVERFNALSPEEQAAHRKEQRQSFVRGQLGMGLDADEAHERQLMKAEHHAMHYQTGPSTLADAIEVQSPLTPAQMGYTGDTCAVCQSTRMLRTGHCSTCQDCGSTTDCA